MRSIGWVGKDGIGIVPARVSVVLRQNGRFDLRQLGEQALLLVDRRRTLEPPVGPQLTLRGPCNAQWCGLHFSLRLMLDLHFEFSRVRFEQSLFQPLLLLPAE